MNYVDSLADAWGLSQNGHSSGVCGGQFPSKGVQSWA
jgi:hypothetical protein